MNNIHIFSNPLFGEIRTATMPDGQIGFVGKDVAKSLGYSNTRDAMAKHVEVEDKTTVAICDTGSNYKTQATLINESGLYSLILSSKLPQAKQFKHWVTAVVLPSIRQNGFYANDEVIQRFLNNPAEAITFFATVKREQEQAGTDSCSPELVRSLENCSSCYYMGIMKEQRPVDTATIANDYGVDSEELLNQLAQMGIMYRSNGEWHAYSHFVTEGYVQKAYAIVRHKGKAKQTVQYQWTQKGRIYLYEQLRALGIMPGVEEASPLTPLL